MLRVKTVHLSRINRRACECVIGPVQKVWHLLTLFQAWTKIETPQGCSDERRLWQSEEPVDPDHSRIWLSAEHWREFVPRWMAVLARCHPGVRRDVARETVVLLFLTGPITVYGLFTLSSGWVQSPSSPFLALRLVGTAAWVWNCAQMSLAAVQMLAKSTPISPLGRLQCSPI